LRTSPAGGEEPPGAPASSASLCVAAASSLRVPGARDRNKRAPPPIDRKIVTGWNGLMISAFARAGFALAEPRYTKQAVRAAEFLLASVSEKGQLKRSC